MGFWYWCKFMADWFLIVIWELLLLLNFSWVNGLRFSMKDWFIDDWLTLFGMFHPAALWWPNGFYTKMIWLWWFLLIIDLLRLWWSCLSLVSFSLKIWLWTVLSFITSVWKTSLINDLLCLPDCACEIDLSVSSKGMDFVVYFSDCSVTLNWADSFLSMSGTWLKLTAE